MGIDYEDTAAWSQHFGPHDVQPDKFSPPNLADLRLRDENDLARLAIIDLMAGNFDRHSNNILYAHDEEGYGVLMPIDHEIAMTAGGVKNLPEGYDEIVTELRNHTLVYDEALKDFVLSSDPAELRAGMIAEMRQMRTMFNNMYWVSEENKQLSLDRLQAMQIAVDAVIERFRQGGVGF